jgi:hypothetical protein
LAVGRASSRCRCVSSGTPIAAPTRLNLAIEHGQHLSPRAFLLELDPSRHSLCRGSPEGMPCSRLHWPFGQYSRPLRSFIERSVFSSFPVYSTEFTFLGKDHSHGLCK